MPAPISIAVKLLASLNQPGSCDRCFWIHVHQKHLPFSLFPGIFNSLDSYTKHLVAAAYSQGGLPPWLARATGFVDLVPVPHFSRFSRLDPASNIIICGAPDAMFRRRDRTFGISDFTTAKCSPKHKCALCAARATHPAAQPWPVLPAGQVLRRDRRRPRTAHHPPERAGPDAGDGKCPEQAGKGSWDEGSRLHDRRGKAARRAGSVSWLQAHRRWFWTPIRLRIYRKYKPCNELSAHRQRRTRLQYKAML